VISNDRRTHFKEQYHGRRCGVIVRPIDRVAWSVGMPVGLSVTQSVGRSVCQSVDRSDTLANPAKTAEAIEMPFASRTLVDPRNHVLDGVRIPHVMGQF